MRIKVFLLGFLTFFMSVSTAFADGLQVIPKSASDSGVDFQTIGIIAVSIIALPFVFRLLGWLRDNYKF